VQAQKIISLALLFGLLAPAASARKRSWQAVEKLPPGASISVKSDWLRTQCTFVRAADEELVCRPIPPMQPPYRPWPPSPVPFPYPPAPPPPPPLAFYDRKDVLEVRLEHSVAVNVLTGVVIGAGAGAGLGAAANGHGTLTRGGSALLGGLIFGLIGGVIGRNSPPFHRGVIYKRGDALRQECKR
jgi:hypothetical protein